jgi:hypothetical protein
VGEARLTQRRSEACVGTVVLTSVRYLINVPLFIAFVSLAHVFDVTVLSGAYGGGTAYEVVLEIGIGWIMLAVVIASCGAMGGFPWPRVRGAGGFMVGLLAYGGIVFVSLTPLGIAMETDASIAGWGIDQAPAARLVAFGLPLVLLLYAGWIVNAPAVSRDSRTLHGVALGMVGLLCCGGAVVSMREMVHEDRKAQAEAVAADQAKDEHVAAQRRELAALTDASPLIAWDAYAGDNVASDVREEALRRLAARPQLEADLSEALASDNENWSAEALRLIVRVPFAPSAALAQPVRDAIDSYTDRLMRESNIADRDGDKRLDYYEGYTLGVILKVAERMADSAGVDLSGSIDAVARAVALYPRSDVAHSFPAQEGAAKSRVGQILASRRGPGERGG